MNENQARLNITWSGGNGDLPDPIFYDSSERDIKSWAKEAVSSGSVPGIAATPEADFADFVVDRFPASGEQPNRIFLRPKAPFGAQ